MQIKNGLVSGILRVVGKLKANSIEAEIVKVSSSDISTSQVRNIRAGTSDLTAGSSGLATGEIYVVYE